MASPKDAASSSARAAEDKSAPNLAAIVVQKGWATPEQVQAATRKAKAEKTTLSQALIALGILSDVQIRRALGDRKAGSDKPRVLDSSVVNMIKGYRIERRLGSGGMGDVFLAQQTSLDRPVALKILPVQLAKDEEFVQRFLSEARAAGKVAHENIVAAVDVGVSNGRYYFVMELVDGLTLQQKIEREGPIPEKAALEIAKQVARGLRHAHQQGLIHRDIKPANIMFTGENVVKICDFGLARRLDEDTTLTMPGMVQSSPAYASPEQCRGRRDLDHRTDMYSLGVTLFEMLTGKRPFWAESSSALFIKHATEAPPSPQSFNPALSAAASQLVLRLLRKEPKQRFESYDELIEAIEGVQQSKPAPKLKVAPTAHPRPVAVRRFPWTGAVVSLVLIGAAAAGLVWLSRRPSAGPAETESRAKAPVESDVDLLIKSVAALEKRSQENPSEIPAVRARWKDLVEQFRSTPQLAAIARQQMEFETRVSDRADAEATRSITQAEGQWASNHPGEALRILGGYSTGFGGTPGAARVTARATEWTKTLEERFRVEREKALALLAAGKPAEARTSLAAMKALDFARPEFPVEVEKLRARIDEASVVAKPVEAETPKSDAQANRGPSKEPPSPVFLDPARVLRNPALRADPRERSKAAASFRALASRSALCRAADVFLSHDDRFWKLGGDRLKLKTEQVELDLEGQAQEDGKNTVFQAINGHRVVLQKDGKASVNGGSWVTPLRADLTRNIPTPLLKVLGDYLAALPLERADTLTTAEHQGQFVGLAKKIAELGDPSKDVLYLFALAHADELFAQNLRPEAEGIRLARLQAAKTADLWGLPATVNRVSLARLLGSASPLDVHRAAEPLAANIDFPSRLLCALAAFREKELDPVAASAAWKKLAGLVPETSAAKFCDEIAERLRKASACDGCAGQGKYPCKRCSANGIAECEKCKGSGRIKENDLTGMGLSGTIPCPTCKQKGRFLCPVCQGGKVAKCDKCDGKKVRKLVAGSEFQDTLGAHLCSTCAGSGSIYAHVAYPCPDCDGLGRFSQK
jgi:serine/threonine-protein kinase